MRKRSKYRRGTSTSRICFMLEKEGIFDRVFYKGSQGCQPGAYVELHRDNLEALLRREGRPSADCYNGTPDNPTRIGYLSISKDSRDYGLFDPQECVHSPRHKFEKNAEKDPELKKFLEDILEHFNKI